MKKPRLVPLMIFILTFVLLLGGFGLYYWGYRSKEILMAQAEKAGLALTLEEVENRYRKDAANAAEYYEQAFDLHRQWIEAHDDLSIKALSIPADRYKTAEENESEAQAVYTRYVRDNPEILDLFRTAAKMKYCYFSLETTREDPLTTVSYLGPLRDFASVMSRDAICAIRSGRVEQMSESVETLFRIGRHVMEQPFYLSHLVGIRIQNLGINTIETILNEMQLDDDCLHRLSEQVATVYCESDLQDAIRSETACGKAYIFDFDRSRMPGWLWHTYSFVQGPQVAYRDYLTGMIRLSHAAEAAWPDKLDNVRSLKEIYSTQQSRYFPSRLASMDFDFSDHEKIFLFNLSILVRHTLCQAALAVERYSNQHNELPKTLDELVPEYLEQVPQDYFIKGQVPICYEVTESGYVLYSVSADGIANGGQEMEGHFDSGSDLVFRVKRLR